MCPFTRRIDARAQLKGPSKPYPALLGLTQSVHKYLTLDRATIEPTISNLNDVLGGERTDNGNVVLARAQGLLQAHFAGDHPASDGNERCLPCAVATVIIELLTHLDDELHQQHWAALAQDTRIAQSSLMDLRDSLRAFVADPTVHINQHFVRTRGLFDVPPGHATSFTAKFIDHDHEHLCTKPKRALEQAIEMIATLEGIAPAVRDIIDDEPLARAAEFRETKSIRMLDCILVYLHDAGMSYKQLGLHIEDGAGGEGRRARYRTRIGRARKQRPASSE